MSQEVSLSKLKIVMDMRYAWNRVWESFSLLRCNMDIFCVHEVDGHHHNKMNIDHRFSFCKSIIFTVEKRRNFLYPVTSQHNSAVKKCNGVKI